MGKSERGLIAGVLQGVSDVVVPMTLEKHKARIVAQRDAKLHQYSMQQISAQNDYRSSEASAAREHQAGMQTERLDAQRDISGAQMAQSAQQHSESMDLKRAQLDLQKENLGLSRQQADRQMKLLENQLADSDLSRQLNQLKLDDANFDKRLMDVLGNNQATPEERSKAMDLYLLKNPSARRKVIVKQLRDDLGNFIDDFAVHDSSTGQRIDPGSSGGGAKFGSSAWRPGSVSELQGLVNSGQLSIQEASKWVERMGGEAWASKNK